MHSHGGNDWNGLCMHIGDGENDMDGLCMCMWSAAGSNTFAGVLEVIELDINTLKSQIWC